MADEAPSSCANCGSEDENNVKLKVCTACKLVKQSSCANCGKAEELDAKLKTCNACKLVKYCGRECQIAHRRQHKKACMKRAAELRDEALFREPPKRDDCPICFLLLPDLGSGQTFMACCGNKICTGCFHEHNLQSNGDPSCPFCRAELPSTALEYIKQLEKRVDGNDFDAIFQLGIHYLHGNKGMTKDLDKTVKLHHRAAELGSSDACHNLALRYYQGDGVSKDETKGQQYFEKGAMAGCASSRFFLGFNDVYAGSFGRAIKHWLIAASQGNVLAVNSIKEAVVTGVATKDHYQQALRGYLQWMNEVKSDQRDRAAAYSEEYKYL
jgi:TPR repeat protein